ncbi:NADPH-dependent F420 reductase [Pseudomonas sp. MWU13-2105]|uniref:NADPH-dependent F420 reductase n=1 Tax=Pseudomonas sp. MWU13-2105 TaxID=2935074 RepID=UPI00200D4A19|nr:NAD(P)-binding domain-containing protein [Pseudomonas sp. MWU13-2105]
MKIAIVGIGSIGGTLARRLVTAGHEVRVANSRGKEAVSTFAKEAGAVPSDLKDVFNDANAVILSIPQPAMAALPKNLLAALPASVPVVDTSNYYPGLRDERIPALEDGQTESVWVSEQLGRPVIKAFNNILAYSLENLGKPKGGEGRLGVAVAGDDAGHKRLVMQLVDEVGFEPVDSGSLEDSWRQQPCTPAYCCDYTADQMRPALSAAVKGAAAQKREAFNTQLPVLFAKKPSHDEVIAFNRRFNAVN